MMIYFHCSDFHVTPRQRDRSTGSTCCFLLVGLGLVKACFCFYPLLFFDSVQRDGNNLFDVKNDDARI